MELEPSSSSSTTAEVPLIDFVVKWRSAEYPMTLPADSTVGDLKGLLEAETDVLSMRQKLFGFAKGKLFPDHALIGDLCSSSPGAPVRLTMMGTPEEGLVLAPKDMDDLPDVVNDLDWDFSPLTAANSKDIRHRPENQIKLQKHLRKCTINYINPPREGKRLLVLDLDYTLWDHKSERTSAEVLTRPGAHEFLEKAYEDYDLAVWSQTSWSALEAKCTELGFLSHPRYKICFVLDRSVMFTVKSIVKGKEREHEVKALDIIWGKLPHLYSSRNTVHVDDLARNFAMNPRNGIRVEPFMNAPVTRHTDRELFVLSKYLTLIAKLDSFDGLDHSKWREYVAQHEAP